MKYFIDFEAQQYTNEIIEIGCVREDGCQFHSLVHPGEKHKKLSGFVKKLTGITQEELNNAPSVDEVFTRFFYWLGQDGGPAQFYCYGTSDPDFVHASIKLATQLMPQAALSLIVSNMKDYSITVKNHFGLIATPALIKVARYFENNDNLEQTHKAIDDAELLRSVYLGVQRNEPIEEDAFAAYKQSTPPREIDYDNLDGQVIKQYADSGECIGSYVSLEEAAQKFLVNIKKQFPRGSLPELKSLKKKIATAIKTDTPYFTYSWKIEKGE